MKKIKVSIITNLSKPDYKVKDFIMWVNEKYKSYLWQYQALENIFKEKEEEYPTEMIIETMNVK